ncbi:MAG: AAA family ATPase [Candidatus Ratteibacteria bacterium]
MIKRLFIKNFKSIKDLEIECKRVNIFIGEPNTGKSNIIESLGFLSYIAGYFYSWEDAIRISRCVDLFCDQNIKERITIKINEIPFVIEYKNGQLCFNYENQNFVISVPSIFSIPPIPSLNPDFRKKFQNIKFYRFKAKNEFPNENAEFLLPSGENLFTILYTRPTLREIIAGILKNYKIILELDPMTKQISIGKIKEETIIFKFPYTLLSDTLQRVIYYVSAIKTNEHSLLIFEEPESNAFPYYTKYLAETIAIDGKNQYFITTHNPYFLLSLTEKIEKRDINIFITYLTEGRTETKILSDKKIEEMLDYEKDIFLNIEDFLE